MKRGAIESPKILDLGDWLADRLELPTGLAKTLAVGMLEKLWQHTARQTPAGDIGKMSNRRIADAVDWPHDPTELIGVLVRLRLLDEHPVYRLLIHGWSKHSDNYADRHLADSGMLYACGASPRNKPRANSPGKRRSQSSLTRLTVIRTRPTVKRLSSHTHTQTQTQTQNQNQNQTTEHSRPQPLTRLLPLAGRIVRRPIRD